MLTQSQELPEQRHAGKRRVIGLCMRTSDSVYTGESPGLTDIHLRTGTGESTGIVTGESSRTQSGNRAAALVTAERVNFCESGETNKMLQTCSDGSDSRAAQKIKNYPLFQSVNHARVLWDAKCKPKGILGGQLNIRSLIPKRDQVSALLLDSNLDYLCLTESWLRSNIPTNMIDIAGYQCFRKDRITGKGGGEEY